VQARQCASRALPSRIASGDEEMSSRSDQSGIGLRADARAFRGSYPLSKLRMPARPGLEGAVAALGFFAWFVLDGHLRLIGLDPLAGI